jgi:hypothetical protein
MSRTSPDEPAISDAQRHRRRLRPKTTRLRDIMVVMTTRNTRRIIDAAQHVDAQSGLESLSRRHFGNNRNRPPLSRRAARASPIR